MLWGWLGYQGRSHLEDTAEAGRREKQGSVETPFPHLSLLLCLHRARTFDTQHCDRHLTETKGRRPVSQTSALCPDLMKQRQRLLFSDKNKSLCQTHWPGRLLPALKVVPGAWWLMGPRSPPISARPGRTPRSSRSVSRSQVWASLEHFQTWEKA